MIRPIFVSSTFKDMHWERDILHTKVIPEVNALAQEHGEAVEICDLRWGINTSELSEQDATEKILGVCLDEIDRCPYMVVLLGNRYGWMPGEERIKETADSRDLFRLDDPAISVTELEITYGALRNPNQIGRVLFYFREIDGPCDAVCPPEDPVRRQKLDALKAHIRSTPGTHVRTYHAKVVDGQLSDMDDLATMITSDLIGLFRQDWEASAKLDHYALDQKKHLAFLEEKNAQYISRDELLANCIQILEEQKKLLIHGAAGCGKSTLVSRIGASLQQAGHKIIPIYCGYTSLCSSGFDIIRYVAWELECAIGSRSHFADTAGKKITDPAAWNEHIDALLKHYDQTAQCGLVFLIDGADQLIWDDIVRKLSFIPRQEYSHIRFAVSMLDPESAPIHIPRQELTDLTIEERRQVICGILRSKHRELPEPVIDHMVTMENAGRPLYLSLLLQRLLMMSRHDYQQIATRGGGINITTRYQMELIRQCPPTLEALAVHILNHGAQLVGGNIMQEAITLLAVSRRGLRLSDLEGLLSGMGCSWNYLDMVSFVRYMGSAFIYRSDGRLDFAHKSIRQGYLDLCKDTIRFHRMIGHWLFRLPEDDKVRPQEVAWHLMKADDKMMFSDAIAQLMHHGINVMEVSKDVVDAVCSDGGAWLTEVIKACFLTPSFGFLSHFIEYHIFFGLVDTVENLQIKLRLSELMLEAVQKRCVANENLGTIWDISISCDRLAHIHLQFETPAHQEAALKYAHHSLKVRKGLLNEYRKLDTPQKRRQYVLRTSVLGAGLGFREQPSDEQISMVIFGLMNTVYRGICVATEDIAQVLERGDRNRQLAALEHLQNSIRLREQMNQDKRDKLIGEDLVAELSRVYGRAATLCMRLGKKYRKLAGDYCEASLRVIEAGLKEQQTDIRLEVLCAAYVQKSDWYLLEDTPDIDKALELCIRCAAILEGLDVRERTTSTQNYLADIYHRIGLLYGKKGDDASRAAESDYLKHSRELLLDIVSKKPSVQARRNVINAERTQAMSGSNNGQLMSEEAAEAFIHAIQEASQILTELGSEDACNHLNGVINAVIQSVEKAETINEEARNRILEEMKARKLENRLLTHSIAADRLRETVILYAKASQYMMEHLETAPPQLPEHLKRILQQMKIPPEIWGAEPHIRAYQLAKRALLLSEHLFESCGSVENMDMLVVSQAKFSTICMLVSPQEWCEANRKTQQLANALYEKTKREKYMQILAANMLEKRLFGQIDLGAAPELPEEPPIPLPRILDAEKPSEASQIGALRGKLDALEKKKSELKGVGKILAGRNLQKEIDLIKKQLEAKMDASD